MEKRKKIIERNENRVKKMCKNCERIKDYGLIDDGIEVLKLRIFKGIVELMEKIVGGGENEWSRIEEREKNFRKIIGKEKKNNENWDNKKLRKRDIENNLINWDMRENNVYWRKEEMKKKMKWEF